MNRRDFAGLAVAVLASGAGGPAPAAKPPQEWDGLSRVPSKRMKYVYLAPGADFRGYRQVMVDPTEIAFHKDWKRDYNGTHKGLSGRVSDADIQKAITEGGQVATGIFTEAFAKGGYPVVAAPGEDVLRVRTAVLNITVSAPDIPTAGRTRTFAGEAGQATLVIEARDSVTGALLGRVVDGRLAGDTQSLLRNRVTNRSDFRQLVKLWASNSVRGLTELKALSGPSAAG
jgi:hypothetical protein